RARQQARDLLLHARAEVERAVDELRRAAASARTDAELEHAIRTARRRVERQARKQLERAPAEAPAARERPPIEVGARVRIIATGAEGVVSEVRDDRVVVDAGGPRVSVSVAGVTPGAAPAAEPRPARPPSW